MEVSYYLLFFDEIKRRLREKLSTIPGYINIRHQMSSLVYHSRQTPSFYVTMHASTTSTFEIVQNICFIFLFAVNQYVRT